MPEQPEPELSPADEADVQALYRTASDFEAPPANGQNPTHTHVTSAIAGWLVDALRQHAMGERISWDIGFMLMPTPEGPAPVFVIYLQMPSPLVGQLLVEMAVMDPRAVNESNVRQQTADAVGRLVRSRSQAVAGLN
jgi:hypothetical protein